MVEKQSLDRNYLIFKLTIDEQLSNWTKIAVGYIQITVWSKIGTIMVDGTNKFQENVENECIS